MISPVLLKLISRRITRSSRRDVEKLKDGWSKLTKGYKAYSDMMINQAMCSNGRGPGYVLEKAKEERKTKPIKYVEDPYTYKCVECGQTGHSSWM